MTFGCKANATSFRSKGAKHRMFTFPLELQLANTFVAPLNVNILLNVKTPPNVKNNLR